MKHLALFLTLSFFALQARAQDPWRLRAEAIDTANYYGATVANGMLGIMSSPTPLHCATTILYGAYDGDTRSAIPRLFDNIHFLDLDLVIDGQPCDRQHITGHRQELDMRQAQFREHFVINGKATVDSRTMALRQMPFAALTIVTVMPQRDLVLTVANRHRVPAGILGATGRYRMMKKKRANLYLLATDARSALGRHGITATSSFLFPTKDYPTVTTDSASMMTFSVRLRKGEAYTFGLTGAVQTTATHPDAANEADRLAIFASLTGMATLERDHLLAWDRLWQSDITITGDAQAQQDVHGMLYQLYSAIRDGSRLSIPPAGLTALTYNGHIFWDAEIWMYPALLVLHPELARQMISYRIDRLRAAQRNAFAHGYSGAMMPWESADSGLEDTPSWATTGTNEHHITGCVAMAAWQYFCVTRDTLWLRDEAWPLLRETADFWISRMQQDSTGQWHIRNVVCADEYAANVDDNAFTNAIAMENLRITTKAARLLGMPVKAAWQQRQQALPILTMANGVTAEYEGYDGQTIKQADVTLLSYPLKTITEPQQMLRNLEYYHEKIGGKEAPAMTEAISALLYSRLGKGREAGRDFRKGYMTHLCPPFRSMAECQGGTNPYFLTGAGGLLQTVIMGFAGYDITDDGLRQLHGTALPEGWKAVKVKIIGF